MKSKAKAFLKDLWRGVKSELKRNWLFTLWKLAWWPLILILIILSGAVVSIMYLRFSDGVDFVKEIF